MKESPVELPERLRDINDLPLVILICTYHERTNIRDHLVQMLDSVACQQYKNTRLLLLADGVSNELFNFVEEQIAILAFRYQRFNVRHVLKEKQGRAGALDSAIRLAQLWAGGHFAYGGLIDSDDYLLWDTAIEKMIQAGTEAQADIIWSDRLIVNEHDGSYVVAPAKPPSFFYDLRNCYETKVAFFHLCLWPLQLYSRTDGINLRLTHAVDFDFYLKLMECTKRFAHLPEVVYAYRLHSEQMRHQEGHPQMKCGEIAVREAKIRTGFQPL